MLAVVPIPDDSASFDLLEEGLMLPVPGVDGNSILLEARDGTKAQTVALGGILLERDGREVIKLPAVRATALITDARIAVVCSSYIRGGGWAGDPVGMVVLNAASKARAAWRARGKTMVGQVRYPWLQRVGSTGKAGWGAEERLAFDAAEENGTAWRLSLRLASGQKAAVVAAETVRRAATYRLRSETNLEPSERAALERLRTAEPIPRRASQAKNEASFHEFPTFWNISMKSARLKPENAR